METHSHICSTWHITLPAQVHQRIKEEKMNIEIVDRLNQIEIQEQVKWIIGYSFFLNSLIGSNSKLQQDKRDGTSY